MQQFGGASAARRVLLKLCKKQQGGLGEQDEQMLKNTKTLKAFAFPHTRWI